MRLPDSASVFTADVWAIIKALEQIKDSSASKYIDFTDSLSCLQALHHMKLENPLIWMVCLYKLCWVPSHYGIKGNEKADFAKFALDLPRTKVGVSYTDFKLLISQYIFSTWQDDWNGAVAKKLHSVKPGWSCLVSYPDRSNSLTHSYILRNDPPPQCEHCQSILTVRHILLECNNFAREKKDIFGRRHVVESFRFHPTLILLFLKQIEFYYTF